ncbi:MAG: DUF4402 domain-containing protein [Mariniphaga sp.]
MNRTFLPIFLLLLLISSFAKAQGTVSSQAFAEVIEALSANEEEPLHFGRFTPGPNGGSVIITPDGLRSARGTVTTAGGSHSPGRFVVTGAPGTSFTISLPEEETVLVHQQSGNTMQVNGWISDPPSGDAANLADGSRMVSIGASLNIGSMEENPVGIYTGTFVLTFAYN